MDRLFGAFAPAAPAPAAAGQPAGQGQQPAARPNPLFGMLRMAVMWYMVRQFMGSGKQAKDTPREQLLMPKLLKGTPVDMALYLSEAPSFSDFGNKEALIWRETDLLLGQDSERKATYTYRPSRVSYFMLCGACCLVRGAEQHWCRHGHAMTTFVAARQFVVASLPAGV